MNYMGSKSKIAYDILPIMLSGMKEGDAFVDAFCGGCNVIDKVPPMIRRIANDKNKYLIAMFASLTRYEWEPPMHIDKETYDRCREYFNTHRFDDDEISPCDAELGWCGFMASRNGRFFDGGYSGHDRGGETTFQSISATYSSRYNT